MEPDSPSPETGLERVTRELEERSDPHWVARARRIRWPWSPESRVVRQANGLSLEARLEIFRDDLRAIQASNRVLNHAATIRAVEAAEAAMFEMRCVSEAARFAIVDRTQLEMSQQFPASLELLESFRGSASPEMLDAIKEQALHTFSAWMNRLAKADRELPLDELLKAKR